MSRYVLTAEAQHDLKQIRDHVLDESGLKKAPTNTGKNARATRTNEFVQIVAQAFLPVWIWERFFHCFHNERCSEPIVGTPHLVME